jgi:hypothetical protein
MQPKKDYFTYFVFSYYIHILLQHNMEGGTFWGGALVLSNHSQSDIIVYCSNYFHQTLWK